METGSLRVEVRRLDSWKEIAAYLGRDVRTVIRWEKERGLPVQRDRSGPGRPTVFAIADELDAWQLGHSTGKAVSSAASSQPEPPMAVIPNPPKMALAVHKKVALHVPRLVLWAAAAVLIVLIGLAGAQVWKAGADRNLQFARVDFTAGNPMSVAVADVDRDGNPDVVFTNASRDTVDILFGDGQGRFAKRISIPAAREPERLAIADFNGDGFADLAVTYHSSHDVNVLLGDGAGSFRESFRMPAGGRSRWITAADINHDSIPDLVIACSGAKKVVTALGRGDGTFERIHEYGTDGEASSVLVADVTHDGIADLITADYRIAGGNTISVYAGRGDGTFQDRKVFPAGHGPLALAIADVNKDGVPDLMSADFWDSISVLQGNPNGFARPEFIKQGKANGFVVAADMDGDGNTDMVVVSEHSNEARILYGDGSGRFPSSQVFATSTYPDSVAVADFDHDGRPDFVVGSVFGDQVSVYLNRTAR